MAGLDAEVAALVARERDSSIFLTKYKEIDLYAILIWNAELGCHQLIVRHKAENLVNMTHVLRVFDHTKEGASKIFARKNKRTLSLLKGSKSLAGWHAYEGTFVTLEKAEKFVSEEFIKGDLSTQELERNRSKLQKLKLLFHIDSQVVRIPALKDLVKLRDTHKDPQLSPNAQDATRTDSEQAIIVENHQADTNEVDSYQMLSENLPHNLVTGDWSTNGTSSQLEEEEDYGNSDKIDDPLHDAQRSIPPITTAQEADLLSQIATSTSSQRAPSAFQANSFKHQMLHNVEEGRFQKRQRTAVLPISLPILPAISVELPEDDEQDSISNESASLYPTTHRHSSSSRDTLYTDHDSQYRQVRTSQHTQSSEILGSIDIANQMHIVEQSKIRTDNLKRKIAFTNNKIRSLEQELQTARSRLKQEQKQLQQEEHIRIEHLGILKPILDRLREVFASNSNSEDYSNNPSSKI